MKISQINIDILQTGLKHLGNKLYEQPINFDGSQYANMIIFNEHTGNIVIGHKNINKLKLLGYKKVRCVVVDLDEQQEQALKIVLSKVDGNLNIFLLHELMYNLDKDSFS